MIRLDTTGPTPAEPPLEGATAVPHSHSPDSDATVPYVALDRVGLSYDGTEVFRGVSLPLYRGAVTALVGPSGSGKSSLLTCINRLYELHPGARMSGTITVGGEDIHGAGADPVRLRRRVGMIFQKPNPFPMSIRRNLSLPLSEHRLPRAEWSARIEEALTAAALWDEVKDRLDHPAQALSGGQQQRLCIARALILEPEVLLLDEPCSALDPLATEAIEQLVMGLKCCYTMLMVTHNLAQARRVADQVGVLWGQGQPGELVEFGPTAQLFDDPQHPVTVAFMQRERA